MLSSCWKTAESTEEIGLSHRSWADANMSPPTSVEPRPFFISLCINPYSSICSTYLHMCTQPHICLSRSLKVAVEIAVIKTKSILTAVVAQQCWKTANPAAPAVALGVVPKCFELVSYFWREPGWLWKEMQHLTPYYRAISRRPARPTKTNSHKQMG